MDFQTDVTFVVTIWSTGVSQTSFAHNTTLSLSLMPNSPGFASTFIIIQNAFQVLCLVIGLVGLVTNGVVLFVLLRYNHVAKNATNKFIFNQTLIDATCCVALVAFVLVKRLSGSANVGIGFRGWIRCLFVDSTALVVSSTSASQFGLVVIAVERYSMIVHPIGHRKHFRPWMIQVGLIVPWLDGLCTVIIPYLTTTRVVGGQCLSLQFWPTAEMYSAYTVVLFVWQFVFAVSAMVFCYFRIIVAIRRQTLIKRRTDVSKSTAVSSTLTRNIAPSNGKLYEVMKKHLCVHLLLNRSDLSF
jgi:hypothetical protein